MKRAFAITGGGLTGTAALFHFVRSLSGKAGPGTLHLAALRTKPDGTVKASEKIYAVGAMTRGQILDVSTAYGCAVSAANVAEQWADMLQGP